MAAQRQMTTRIAQLEGALKTAASAAAAQSLQRFFPQPIAALGVANAEVRAIAGRALAAHPALSTRDWLAVATHFARAHDYHEQLILASSLAAKMVRRLDDDDGFLNLIQGWLEADVSNWAQCDDLCINPLYLYLKRRPQLLGGMAAWGRSASPWCRRASNVALVKFVGRSGDCDLGQVFANCERLLADPDPYVQKGIGWVLKVAAQYQPQPVTGFLQAHLPAMQRATLRYATEKLAPSSRQLLLRT
jgi:3-methyladenine DNA glycosylase AlkD